MPGADVQVVRDLLDAWFRGDERAQSALVDPAVVVTQLPEQPDMRPHHGREGMRQAIGEWVDTWDDYSLDVLDMREVGARVVVYLHQRGRGRGSGAAMAGDVFFVVSVRAGRVTRLQMFSSEAEALEAARSPG